MHHTLHAMDSKGHTVCTWSVYACVQASSAHICMYTMIKQWLRDHLGWIDAVRTWSHDSEWKIPVIPSLRHTFMIRTWKWMMYVYVLHSKWRMWHYSMVQHKQHTNMYCLHNIINETDRQHTCMYACTKPLTTDWPVVRLPWCGSGLRDSSDRPHKMDWSDS